MGNLNCEIVRDLLPNYLEHLTNPVTNEEIEDHLRGCRECSIIYDQMNESVSVTTPTKDVPVKKFLNKMKSRLLMNTLMAMGIIAMFVCAIVNLAVDHRLSWSLIVFGGVLYFLAVTASLIIPRKRKVEKSIFCITALVLPYLALIQFTLAYLMGTNYGIWFWNMALPITLIWIVTIWLWLGIIYLFKQNWFINGGILCLLSIPASSLTNLIAGSYQTPLDIAINFIANGLGALVIGVVLISIGIRRKRRLNRN